MIFGVAMGEMYARILEKRLKDDIRLRLSEFATMEQRNAFLTELEIVEWVFICVIVSLVCVCAQKKDGSQ